MPWQRRGDFAALIQELKEEHEYEHEIKWKNVKERSIPFYEDLIELFFTTRWLTFHCCLVERAVVRKEFHNASPLHPRVSHTSTGQAAWERALRMSHPWTNSRLASMRRRSSSMQGFTTNHCRRFDGSLQ